MEIHLVWDIKNCGSREAILVANFISNSLQTAKKHVSRDVMVDIETSRTSGEPKVTLFITGDSKIVGEQANDTLISVLQELGAQTRHSDLYAQL